MVELPPRPDWLHRVAVLGVGLLGGSIGQSLRRLGVQSIGYSRSQRGCEQALQWKGVDRATNDLEAACRGSQVVVIATPVTHISKLAAAAAPFLDDDAIVTDVGSTKATILGEVQTQASSIADRFIAAHPIAGSEKTGCEFSSETLFDDRAVVLTPHAGNDVAVIDRATQFWHATGGKVVTMTAAEHDRRLAAVSHVPHLVASALAMFPDQESKPLVGSGWTDMTRVAAGDPEMWTAICSHNQGAILHELDRFIRDMVSLRRRIANHNETMTDPASDHASLEAWLAQAKLRKDANGEW